MKGLLEESPWGTLSSSRQGVEVVGTDMRRDPSITARSYEQLASRGPASDDLLLGEKG